MIAFNYPDIYYAQLILCFLTTAVLGFVLQKTQFCVMGAIARSALFNDNHQVIAWLYSILVAILGCGLLSWLQLVDFSNTQPNYLQDKITAKAAIGGLLFGIGMTLCGGCSSRAITRLSAGNLKSLWVLIIIAVSAYGLMHHLYILNDLDRFTHPVEYNLGYWFIGCTLMVLAFSLKQFRNQLIQPNNTWTIAALSITTILLWYITGGVLASKLNDALNFHDFSTLNTLPQSLTTIAPLTQLTSMITGEQNNLTLGSAIVFGLLVGGAIAAWYFKLFRWDGFANWQDFIFNTFGAISMGFGGVLALGCSFGMSTGLTAFSTNSFIAVIFMFIGCFFTVKIQSKGLSFFHKSV